MDNVKFDKPIDFNSAEGKKAALSGKYGPKAQYVAEKKASGQWVGSDSPDPKFSKASQTMKPAYTK